MQTTRTCLGCKLYRPEDEFTGRCRADKGKIDHRKYPIMMHQDYCERWIDAGQQYYIRTGWLKRLKSKGESNQQDHLL